MRHWREMKRADLGDVMRIAELAHPDLPESMATFEKRLTLFPAGCLVLDGAEGRAGYAFAHPIVPRKPPALDSVPERIVPEARQFYIHDVVVLPELRGQGLAATGIEKLLAIAADHESAALVSVYGTGPFWARFGFRPATLDDPGKLASYGADALFMERTGGR